MDGGCLITHPDSAGLLLSGGEGPASYYPFAVSVSADGGSNWTRNLLSGSSYGCCCALAVSPARPNVCYAGGWVYSGSTYGAIYRSTDYGASWVEVTSPCADTVYGLTVVDSMGEERLFCATIGGLYRSTDAGATWGLCRSTRGMRSVDSYRSTFIAASGDSGVFLSSDCGSTWQGINEGLGDTRVPCLEFALDDQLRLFAGTTGAAVYYYGLAVGIAGAEQIDPARAVRVAPSVANRQVAVRLSGRTGAVPLRIVDAAGRTVGIVTPQGGEFLLDVTGLARGAYSLVPADGSPAARFVKAR